MALLEFKDVRISGFSAGVPKYVETNDSIQYEGYSASDFIEATGIKQRRTSNKFTTSDLCYEAAEKLITELRWDKSEIDVVVFVSQTADYIEPASACILQERLGLSKECYAMDVSLGCSGWVYGLSSVVSLLCTGAVKKALLMVGDAKRRFHYFDPLFGHAGTVTAIEYKKGESGFKFHFGTDGSGYDAIIIPDGGGRNQISMQSFDLEDVDGKMMNRFQTRMKGIDVFAFAITTAPKSIKKLAEKYQINLDDINYLVLHQANKQINDKITKKLNFESKRTLESLTYFGNTSSASIPLSIVVNLKGKIENQPTKFMCCGFGVWLSWGTVYFETDNLVISDLIEVE